MQTSPCCVSSGAAIVGHACMGLLLLPWRAQPHTCVLSRRSAVRGLQWISRAKIRVMGRAAFLLESRGRIHGLPFAAPKGCWHPWLGPWPLALRHPSASATRAFSLWPTCFPPTRKLLSTWAHVGDAAASAPPLLTKVLGIGVWTSLPGVGRGERRLCSLLSPPPLVRDGQGKDAHTWLRCTPRCAGEQQRSPRVSKGRHCEFHPGRGSAGGTT